MINKKEMIINYIVNSNIEKNKLNKYKYINKCKNIFIFSNDLHLVEEHIYNNGILNSIEQIHLIMNNTIIYSFYFMFMRIYVLLKIIKTGVLFCRKTECHIFIVTSLDDLFELTMSYAEMDEIYSYLTTKNIKTII